MCVCIYICIHTISYSFLAQGTWHQLWQLSAKLWRFGCGCESLSWVMEPNDMNLEIPMDNLCMWHVVFILYIYIYMHNLCIIYG